MAIITCMSYMLHLCNIFISSPRPDNDLINISISSHHQVNEINYQCLMNTFVLVLSRSVTLNASTCVARLGKRLGYRPGGPASELCHRTNTNFTMIYCSECSPCIIIETHNKKHTIL